MMYMPQRRREDSFSGRVLTFIKRFFIVTGVAATISFVMLVMTLNTLVNYVPPSLPKHMILTYTFKSGLVEKASGPSISQPLLRPPTTFHEVIDGLTMATKDKRVEAFVARLQDIDLTPAQIQELRDAVAKFRAAGKRAYIFAEDFGGGTSSGMGDYYLASSFGQIWLQPVGAVAVNGVAAEVPFFRGIMEKVGVEADFAHKGIYKSAPESLTETGMSAPHREMMTGLINDLAAQIVSGISMDRKMTAEQVQQLVNGAPYNDSEALNLKLVDKLGYYNQMLEEAKKESAAKDIETVNLLGYSFTADTINLNLGTSGFVSKFARKSDPVSVTRKKAKIGLIVGTGDINSYGGQSHAGIGGTGISADKIVAAFEEVRKDSNVAAVVFRIDSPGGSPAAAETIRNAIVETQKKGVPVIVSMSGYAASGGYWVATPADKIVAEPATITGSIGVFGGKFVVEQLWQKLGVRWESVQSGDNARMWSSNMHFSAREKARFEALLNNIYESFIARVMEGRKMTREQVLAVAEGHVWTGRQAKERGLVDELGGLDRAIELAKVAAKLKPDQDVPVEHFPGRRSTLEMFIELATEGVSISPAIDISAKDVLRSLKAGMDSETDVLKAPLMQIH